MYLLNNQWVNEVIKENIRKPETNENGKAVIQNLGMQQKQY